jgi:hypothetical protein
MTVALPLWILFASTRASGQENPCPEGLVMGARTAGHCCAPDQSWNGWICQADPHGAGPTIQDGTACPSGEVLTLDGRQCCNVADGWYAPDRSSLNGHRLGCNTSHAFAGGGLPATKVVDVVRRHAAAVTACYRDHRVASRVLVDRITMRLTIAENGAVENARTVSSTIPYGSITRCLETVFLAMEFPAIPGHPTNVSYPLAFTPW